MRVFYSWQSDLPNNENRSFIEDCISRTRKKYKDIIEIVADRDTKNKTGSPDITATIFEKIDECDLFIADISIINKRKCRLFLDKAKPTPNPNVLLELGYAACRLGWERIICVYNTDYSDLSALPFDLRQHRILSYSLKGKEKAEVRQNIVNAFSSTIDTLIKGQGALRPKGTHSLHQVLGFDTGTQRVSFTAPVAKIDFATLKTTLTAESIELVSKLNASEITFIGQNNKSLNGFNLDIHNTTIIEIGDKEKEEVVAAVERLLKQDLQLQAFCFGNLKEKTNIIQGGFYLDGTDEEEQKYRDYTQLKRYLTQLFILNQFCKGFDDIFLLPIVIRNVSKYLDTNINVQISIEGDNIQIIKPTSRLISKDLKGAEGYICEYDLVRRLFSMNETRDVKYDDVLTVRDYYDDNPWLNLWDGCSSYDLNDCEESLCDYIAMPNADNSFEFHISSLQAGETKWLEKVILISGNCENGNVKYSIKSDNTDGSVLGNLVMKTEISDSVEE